MTGFRRDAVAREALANLRSRSVLVGVLVVAGIAAPAAALAVSIADVAAITARHQELIGRGATVFSVTATDGDPLPATRCDAIAGIAGVVAAGGVLRVDATRSDLVGDRSLELWSATPGLAAILWPGSGGTGIIAGASLAADLGLASGAELPLDGEAVTIGEIAAHSPRADRADFTLLVTSAPVGGTRECLVEAQPGAERAVEGALLGWFDGVQTSVQPIFALPQTGRSPGEELSQRLTVWLVPLAAAALAATIIGRWLARRADFALYAIAGLRRSGLLIMLAIEWLGLVVLPGVLGLVLALAASEIAWTRPVIEAAALDIARYLLAISPIPIAGLVLLGRVSALDALKGR